MNNNLENLMYDLNVVANKLNMEMSKIIERNLVEEENTELCRIKDAIAKYFDKIETEVDNSQEYIR